MINVQVEDDTVNVLTDGEQVNGLDGTTFTPSVSDEGVISWTNDGGKENPASKNIKGAKGDTGETGAKGDKGDTGEKGDKGDTGTFNSVTASVDANVGTPSVGVTYASGDVAFAFHNLKGETGATGAKGDKGDDGEDGSIVSVSATGTSTDEVSYITIDGTEKKLGGVSDYTQLNNLPQVNSVTLTGNKSSADLGINASIGYDASETYASGSVGNELKEADTHIATVNIHREVVELTQAQYDALPSTKTSDGKLYHITDAANTASASSVPYVNTTSGLTATNVQSAIDEVVEETDDRIGGLGNAIGMRGWNQLYPTQQGTTTVNGVTFVADGSGKITANGTATSNAGWSQYISLINGHKYFVSGCQSGGSLSTYFLYINDGGGRADLGNGTIFTASSTASVSTNCYIISGYTATNIVFKPQCIDLTVLFGSGNEPTTVAEFRAMFPADYYPYCANGWTKISEFTASASASEVGDLSGYKEFAVAVKRSSDYTMVSNVFPYDVFYYAYFCTISIDSSSYGKIVPRSSHTVEVSLTGITSLILYGR